MRFSLWDEKNSLGIAENFLLTRPIARRFVPRLEEFLKKKGDKEGLEVDFDGILTADTSFIDELLIVHVLDKMRERKIRRTGIFVTNLTDSVLDNARSVFAEKKIPLLFKRKARDFELLGHLEKNLQRTLKSVLDEREINAKKMEKRSGKPINVASTKLSRLFKLSLVLREETISEKGREYNYYSQF